MQLNKKVTEMKISKLKRFAILSLLCVISLAGCDNWFGPVMHQAPIERMPKDPAKRNFLITWNSAINALKDSEFKIYREDKRDGIIMTNAELAPHGIEALFRRDHVSGEKLLENSIHSIYRAAKVTIYRVEGTNEFKYSVKVLCSRSEKQHPNYTSSGQIETRSEAGVDKKTSYKKLRKPSALNYLDLKRSIDPVRRREEKREHENSTLNPKRPERPEDFLVPLGRDKKLERAIESQIRFNIRTYKYVTD